MALVSPSMRREWIEIQILMRILLANWSPSMRREWIEISQSQLAEKAEINVSLHAEGVD